MHCNADIFKPAAVISLCLQDDELDVVAGIKSILKLSGSLKNMAKTEPKEWPTVKLVQDRIRSEGNDKLYQGVCLTNFNDSSEKWSIGHALNDLQRLNTKNTRVPGVVRRTPVKVTSCISGDTELGNSIHCTKQ